MKKSKNTSRSLGHVLEQEDVKAVLQETFYLPGASGNKKASATPRPKPDHYEVICISIYREDLERLDQKVATLKKGGHRKMSRSALIRYALDTADLSAIPRGY